MKYLLLFLAVAALYIKLDQIERNTQRHVSTTYADHRLPKKIPALN
jgi:hypothetical protein